MMAKRKDNGMNIGYPNDQGQNGGRHLPEGFCCWIALSLILASMILGCAAGHEETRKQSEAYRNIGEAYLAQGNITAGLQQLLQAEKIYADDPYLQNDLGIAYLGKNRPDLAIVHFEKAVSLKADYAPAINNLGTAYMAMKNWDQAIAAFQRITDDLLYATPHYPLANIGMAYYHKQDYALAQGYFEKALKIDPGFPVAVKGLARTYVATGQSGRAIALLEDKVKLRPQAADLWLELGDLYLASQKTQKAADAFQTVMKLAPGTDLARTAEEKRSRIAK
jgi:type IV pilus biogenesis/stability protein PilW